MTEDQTVAAAISYSVKKSNPENIVVHRTVYSGVCAKCSEIFFTIGDSTGFCSKKCAHKRLRGPAHQSWRGGRGVDGSGYVLVYAPEHPKAHQGRVKEHVLVMEKHLGRLLRPGENVHHKNGVRGDNRVENLELWVRPQPAGQRVFDLISWAVSNYPAETRAILECADASNHVLNGANHAISKG